MSMHAQIVLAVDIGTTSTKALAIDEAGRCLASHSIGYPLLTPSPGYAEQDPATLYEAVVNAIANLMQQGDWDAEDVICVSFSSANHSLILLDAQGEPLTPCITWADQRSAAEAQRLLADGTGLPNYARTGTPIHPMSPLVKLIWMREQRPELFESAVYFAGIKEYIFNKMLGQFVMDYSLASATGMFNLQTLDWDAEALNLAGVRKEQLPQLVPTTAQLGGLRDEIAARTGLRADTPFVAGAQDGVLANLGIGAIEEGVLAVTIGTSSAVRTGVSRPTFDAQGRLFCYALAQDKWIIGGPSNNGAIVAQWISERLFPGRPMEEVLPLADEVPAGANGLLFMPLLAGERAPFWDAQGKGVMFGLTLAHNEKHMLRAALEGVLFQIAGIVGLMKQSGQPINEVRASGGFARSAIWCQMLADMLGVPVMVPDQVESSGLGAAQLGLYAMDECHGSLLRWVVEGHVYTPDAAKHRVYEELLPLYLGLYDNLKDSMHAITKFQTSGVLS